MKMSELLLLKEYPVTLQQNFKDVWLGNSYDGGSCSPLCLSQNKSHEIKFCLSIAKCMGHFLVRFERFALSISPQSHPYLLMGEKALMQKCISLIHSTKYSH